jgi:geranylgeranyl diphosphate synthase type II
MTFLQRHTDFLEKELKQLELPVSPKNLYDPLRYFLMIGGKRIRPILTLISGELFGADLSHCKNAALAIELFHNFTLIHDDIMDNAPLRRSQQTVHEKWNTNIAILSGDVLFVKAYELLSYCSERHIKDLLALFSKTAREVCEGQQMDMDFETRFDVSETEYIEMIRLKTSVLLGCALEMGAIIGNVTKEERKLIYNFGVHLGIAFQIQDDILDLFGDPEKVGKQPGGDVISNKKTLLSIKAKQLANDAERNQLLSLEIEADSVKKVLEVKAIYEALKVKTFCQKIMNDHFSIAMNSLSEINTNKSKVELIQLADFLFNREH